MAGVLEISDTDIDLTLVDYDGRHFGLAADTDDNPFEWPLILRTESDQIVTFYGVEANSRSHGDVTAHKFVGNRLTIGQSALTENAIIKCARFEVPYCECIIAQPSRTKRHTQDQSFEGINEPIFSIELDDCTLSAKYRKSIVWGRKNTDLAPDMELSVYIEIDFKVEVNLDTYSQYVWTFIRLLSLSVGEPFRPKNIAVYTISASDICNTNPFERRNYRYQVQYTHTPLAGPDRRSIANAIITATDDTELASFQDCVRKWFDGFDEWHSARGLMFSSLRYGNHFDPDRIVNAVRWLEKIPTAQHHTVISDIDTDTIVKAAQSAANKLGYAYLDSRLASVIKSVRTESHRQRFERLKENIKELLGQDILPNSIVDDLYAAVTRRSSAAHGGAQFKNRSDTKEFTQFVYAMEAFCVVLMAVALPLSDRGKTGLTKHKIVQRYKDWCQQIKAADGL